MSAPIYSCMTKGIVADEARPTPSTKWATSRRARLRMFDDRLECGDWMIPHSEIREAVLHSGAGLLVPGYVLLIRTDSKTYQFGLNPMPFWKRELPFPVGRVGRTHGQTAAVFAVRGLALAALGYWLWAR